MKVLIKILIVIFIVFFLIIGVDGFIAINVEIRSYENNLKNNFIQLGNTILTYITEAWQKNDIKKVVDIINGINKSEHNILVRLILLNDDKNFKPDIDLDKFYKLIKNNINFYELKRNNIYFLYGYFPAKINNETICFLELSQSLNYISILKQKAVYRIIFISILLLISGFILVWVFGIKYISKPLDILTKRMKKISSNDFTKEETLKTKDELYELEKAINSMCEKLELSRKNLDYETEKRIQVLEELKHSERLATIGKISSGIAHEIGTPLNVIQGRASMIINEKLNQNEIKDFSKIIIDQAKKMTDIIQQLLNYARIEVTDFKKNDIIKLINNSIILLSPIIKKSNIEINFNRKFSEFELIIDSTSVQQVITNILMNAIDAMPDGGKIEISIDEKELIYNEKLKKYFEIKITDNGEGIPEENLERIFDPFFTTKKKEKGTGLGLSISNNIIESHKGFIKVESKINKGSVFSIYLPIIKE